MNDIENDNVDVYKMEELYSNGIIGEYVLCDCKDLLCDLLYVFEFFCLNKCCWWCKVIVNGIDVWLCILFFLVYGFFIVVYWIIYLVNMEKSFWFVFFDK